jgi:hypothetical protein
MTDLTDLMFHNDDAARTNFESTLWPNGPVCPHCHATGWNAGNTGGQL